MNKGKVILRKYPHAKFRDRLLFFKPSLRDYVTIQAWTLTSTWLEKDDRRLVACGKELYPLPEKGCVNNQTWEKPKFFFAIIRKGTQLFADYLEPYFANLDNLHKLK